MRNIPNQFTKRMASALVVAPIVIFMIYWSAWSYFFLFFYVIILAMLEFYKLLKMNGGALPLRLWGTFIGSFVYTITFMCVVYGISKNWLYALIPFFLMTYIIKLHIKKAPHLFMDIAYTFLGILYIAVPFAMFHVIVFLKGYYSYEIALGIIFIVWLNDIGAYLLGSIIGKHKLFERVSPNKTWEGVIGGGLASLLGGGVIAKYFIILAEGEWFVMSIIIMVAGTYGDLVASSFKRSMHVKNASNMIPGHGGILDRIDSLIITLPLILFYINFFLDK